jgi:hypothetical protein
MVCFAIGGSLVASVLPDSAASEPGLVSAPIGLSIIANPLMPVASVRVSHMIETATSTFLFGTLVVWLLHREHRQLTPA